MVSKRKRIIHSFCDRIGSAGSETHRIDRKESSLVVGYQSIHRCLWSEEEPRRLMVSH